MRWSTHRDAFRLRPQPEGGHPHPDQIRWLVGRASSRSLRQGPRVLPHPSSSFDDHGPDARCLRCARQLSVVPGTRPIFRVRWESYQSLEKCGAIAVGTPPATAIWRTPRRGGRWWAHHLSRSGCNSNSGSGARIYRSVVTRSTSRRRVSLAGLFGGVSRGSHGLLELRDGKSARGEVLPSLRVSAGRCLPGLRRTPGA